MNKVQIRSKFSAFAVSAALAAFHFGGPLQAQAKDNLLQRQETNNTSAPQFHLGGIYASSNDLGKWIELSNGQVKGPLWILLTSGQSAWVMASSSATPPTEDPLETDALLLESKANSIYESDVAELFPDHPGPKRLFVYFSTQGSVAIIHGVAQEPNNNEENPQTGDDGEILPGRGATGGSKDPADFVISTPDQWQATMSKTAQELSGKVIEIRGEMGNVTLKNIDIPADQEPLYLRQGEGGSIRHLYLRGVVRNVYFQNIRFQMRGWPKLEPNLIQFGTGTFDKLTFDGVAMRHGYGPSQLDFDVTKEYPEYKRVDHVQTATTSSKTHELTWQDPSMEKGWVEFFNRGKHRVNVAIGSADVQAPGPNECCSKEKCSCRDRNQCVDPGKKVRFCGVNIADTTHFSVRSDEESAQVNARTEIGLSRYLARAFGASGAAKIGDLTFRNMLVSDLSNAFKGLGKPKNIVIMDNKIDRIYMDTIAVAPGAEGASYVLRNLISTPFARSGIPEDRNGDAGDPHGDQHQMFGDGKATIENVYSAGNRSIKKQMRPGVISQGAFFSDNDIAPSYRKVFSISDMHLGGASHGWMIGERGFPAEDIFLYGATIVDGTNFENSTRVNARISPSSHMYVGRSFSSGFPDNPLLVQDQNVEVAKRSPELFFEDYNAAASSTSRASIESALTSVGPYAQVGAVATRDAVDWKTLDATKVIRWENIPSGVAWDLTQNVAPGTVIESKKRKVLNRMPAQTVEPDDGVEWQIIAEDGETVIQNWSSSSGTIEPDQSVKIRFTAPLAELHASEKGLTINGFHQTKRVVTSASITNPWQLGEAWFSDVGHVPEDTTVIEYEAKFMPRSMASTNDQIFGQLSAGGFRSSRQGAFKMVGVENSAGESVYSADRRIRFEPGVVYVVNVKIDFESGEVTTRVNGEIVESGTMRDLGEGVAQSRRAIILASSTGRAQNLPKDWEFEYLTVHLTTGGERSLHKELSMEASGSVAGINADAWHKGGAVLSP